MRKIVQNVLAALALLGAWLVEVYATKRYQAPSYALYSPAWSLWIAGPVLFALVNGDAFQGVAMRLRFALVAFMAVLLTVLSYVLLSPVMLAIVGWAQARTSR